MTGPSSGDVLITVHYTDNKLLRASSFDASDMVITRLWDNHVLANIAARFRADVGCTDATVVYRLPAPSGTWGTLDDGDYSIALGRRSGLGPELQRCGRQSELGTFNVDTTPGLIRVNATYDAVDVNPGDGVADDGTGHATLRAAIMEANALAGANTIRIPPGTYTLSIAGAGEDLSVDRRPGHHGHVDLARCRRRSDDYGRRPTGSRVARAHRTSRWSCTTWR